MSIRANCPCGCEYSFQDSAAGKHFTCNSCGQRFLIAQMAVAAASTEDEIETIPLRQQAEDGDATSETPAPRRKKTRSSTPATKPKAQTKESAFSPWRFLRAFGVETSESAGQSPGSEPSLRKKLILVLGGALAVGAAMYAACLFSTGMVLTMLIIPLSLIGSPIGMFLLTDAYYRWWIRTEIESYGGTVDRIQWKPLQGSFFTRGWHRGPRCRFYQVTYRDRHNCSRSDLCAIHFLQGAAWGDDIDELVFVPIWNAQTEQAGLWGVIILAVIITTYVAINETAYAVLSTNQAASVVESHTVNVQRRNGGRRWTEKETRARYEWKDSTGATRLMSQHFRGESAPQTIDVQALPGGFGARRPGPTFGQTWLKISAGIAGFFALLYGLDYFDVFGVHAHARRRAQRDAKF